MPTNRPTAPGGVEGLGRIENHVLSKARAEAAEIASKAGVEAERIAAAAREECDKRSRAELDRVRADLAAESEREAAVLRGRGRAERLAMKSRILDDVFRKAAERLVKDGAYWDLLRRRLRDLAGQKGRVLCRAEHREALGRHIAELNRETGGKAPALADESADILGGFILRGDHVDVDFTLETELAAFRERILPELAAKAFPDT